MKILHLNDSYEAQGGVQQYLLSVGRLLDTNGHENVVVYTDESPLTIRDGSWPAYRVCLDRNPLAQVEAILGTEKPDVAYIHHSSSPELIRILSRLLPAVAYVHGFSAVCPGLGKYHRRGDIVCAWPFGWRCVPANYLLRCSSARNPATLARLIRNAAAMRQALLHVPVFLVGTRYMAALLAQNAFPAERISVLPPHFLLSDASLPYVPPTEPAWILFAGRLEIEKGFPYLLRALGQLPRSVQLIVAGEGTQRKCYEALARELGLANRVSFLGWLDEQDMVSIICRCSVVVMPSIFPEPFGKVGVEALAHGRPVVAFDVGGISDWLVDGVNGFLVRPRNVAGLAARIQQLLEDERLQLQMGQAGQARVLQRYPAAEHLSALLAAFQVARGAYAEAASENR